MSTYQTIAAPSTGLYKEKGSKFLAFVYPIASETEVKEIMAKLRKEYFDARHHCYAYRLGAAGDQYRANDDGEPNHAAGDPILGQLKSANLTNILLVVVRYFGGIKLGVSGLIQAYKTAAYEALTNAQVVQKTEQINLTLHFEYDQLNEVMRVVKEQHLMALQPEFNITCTLVLQFPKTEETTIRAHLQTIAQLRVMD